MKLFRNILSLLLAGFLLAAPFLLLLGGALAFRVSQNPRQSYFGYRFYHVLTRSMEPAFKAGDIIVVKLCGPEDVQVGDIITFNPSPNPFSPSPDLDITVYITHRVVRIIDGTFGLWFITKGDANEIEDPLIAAAQLVGKVTGRLPGMGSVRNSIRDHLVGALLAALCAILLCWGLALFVLIRLALRGRRAL